MNNCYNSCYFLFFDNKKSKVDKWKIQNFGINFNNLIVVYLMLTSNEIKFSPKHYFFSNRKNITLFIPHRI